MANPQVEHGYIKISTELFKEIYYRITNPTHLRLVLFVIRFSYGYKRKDFETNVSSITKALRITNEYCRNMLYDMEKSNILKIKWHSVYKLWITLNKNYEKWTIDR